MSILTDNAKYISYDLKIHRFIPAIFTVALSNLEGSLKQHKSILRKL